MANYKTMMDRWKDWRLDEAIENETSLPFEVIGSNAIMINGKKLTVKLKFNGNDLKNAIEGKKKKGKVILASVNIK